MTNFVILRIAADGIYECVGRNAKGFASVEEATDEARRILREDPVKPETYHLAVFEREAIYANETIVVRK